MQSHSLLVAVLALGGSIAFASTASATVNIQLSGDVTTTLTNSGQDPSAVQGRLQRDLNKGLEELGRTNPAARALFASNQTIRIVCYGSAEANNAGLNPGEGLFPAPAETRGDFNADGTPRAGGTVIIAINCDQLRQKGLDTPVFDIDPDSSLFRVLIHELLHATNRARNHQTDDQDLYSNFVRDFLAALEGKRVAELPMIGDGTFNGARIADNENPRPMDRIYLAYDLFNTGGPAVTRTTIGFERTFLDGDASFGLRLPFFNVPGPGFEVDLTLIGKYAFLNDPDTGNFLSAGLAFTLPLGPGNSIIQPFLAGQTERNNVLIQGFTSLINPVGVVGNNIFTASVGFGFRAVDIPLGDGVIQAVIPTAELNLNKPLGIPGFELNVTAGAHFLFAGGATGHVGLTIPVGPLQPYDARFTIGFQTPIETITDLVRDVLRQ